MLENVPAPINQNAPKFIDQFRAFIRLQGLAYTTEKTYIYWVRQFIFWHKKRHPKDMGAKEVSAFLEHLCLNANVAPNTQRTALNALSCLYNKFLVQPIPDLSFRYSRKQPRVPTVFTHSEALAVIAWLSDPYMLMAQIMYGGGLRVNEVVQLRVKDVDFAAGYIVVRNGKGSKERTTEIYLHVVDNLGNAVTSPLDC